MSKQFELKIQSPDATLFSGMVDSVKLETELGQLMVLPGHTDLMGSIVFSEIEVVDGSHTLHYFLRNGVMRVSNKNNNLLVQGFDVHKKDELSHMTIREYLDFVVNALKTDQDLTEIQVKYLKDQESALTKMLDVVKKEKEG